MLQNPDSPAGGTYQGEIANNQAFTSLGFGGKYAGAWTAGTAPPVIPGGNNCISSPLRAYVFDWERWHSRSCYHLRNLQSTPRMRPELRARRLLLLIR